MNPSSGVTEVTPRIIARCFLGVFRLLYTFFQGDAWILTGYIKKTQKIPDKELQRARDRKAFLENR